MKRRKLISGLGTLSATGAIAIGTGAFTSARANRTVSVRAVGDANAFLQITKGSAGSYVTGTESQGTLDIDLADSFNENAITVIDNLLDVNNQSADGATINVGLSTADPSASPSTNDQVAIDVSDSDDGSLIAVFYVGSHDSRSTATSLTSGASASIGAIIDSTGDNYDSEANEYTTTDGNSTTLSVATDDNLTIVADSS
jgi:hypothetical protein